MSVDLYAERDLRAAIDELAGEAPDISPVIAALPRQARRREIRWLAPLAAAAVVLLVVGIVVFVSRHSSKDGDTLAVGRTEATAAQPCRSSTAPDFDTFTIIDSGLPAAETTCSGYRSQSVVHAGTVVLYRPGVFDLALMPNVRKVSAYGIEGYAGRLSKDPSRQCDIGSLRQSNCEFDVVAWRYTDDAWGLAEGSPGQSTRSLLHLASRVRLTPMPVRFPVNLGKVPAGLHASRVGFVDAYGLPVKHGQGSFFAHLTLARGDAVGASISVAVAAGRAQAAGRPVSIGPDTGYLTTVARSRSQLTMRHSDCDLVINARQPTTGTELVRMLRSATFADCGDEATWPTANDAVGG